MLFPLSAPRCRLLIIGTIIGGVILVLAASITITYGASTHSPWVIRMDHWALNHALAARSPRTGMVVTWFTNLGSTPWSAPIATTFALYTAWRWRDATPIFLMAGATVLSTTVTRLLKLTFERIRPLHEVAVPPFEHTFSFPSGHTLNAVVIAGVMAYLLCQHTRSAGLRTLISGCGIAYALLMGISRVFLAHHWLSDVLAGWCIGSLCLTASIVVERATAYIRQGRLHDRDSSSPSDEYSRNPVRP